MSLDEARDSQTQTEQTESDGQHGTEVMSARESTLATLSRSVDLGCGVEGGLLAVTIGDVRKALGAGFSASEVEYMLDLPRGRAAIPATDKAFA